MKKITSGSEKGWFKKGNKPWNIGIKFSEEVREKMSKSAKGRKPWNYGKKAPQIALSKMGDKHSRWKGGTYNLCNCGSKKQRRSLECRSCANKGKKSPTWRGGINRAYKQGYYSKEYKDWRIAVIESFAFYPDLRFEIDNGKTLCVECHKNTPNYGYKAKLGKEVVQYGKTL
jgi:hypothetical protein